MKTLSSGDDRITRIVCKKKLRADAAYRLSGFAFAHEAEGQVLLQNTLTRRVYALSREEWAAAQGADLSLPVVEELAKQRFLVEEGYDEVAQYTTVVQVVKTMAKEKPGICSYTVLPTTACNARCFYCYEEGWPAVTMTEQVADRVVDWICKTKRQGPIHLGWFGGEPLCAPKIVSHICRGLTDRGVEFASSIITNGTLFTPELVWEARELWRLNQAQLSMDGAREDYERRKRYVDPTRHNYDRAMEAAALLADAGIQVTIRCNYDADNLPGLREFFDDCRARFRDRKNVRVYANQLFETVATESGNDLYAAGQEAERYAQDQGLPLIWGYRSKLQTNHCCADSGTSVIIDPKGRLQVCEHESFDSPLGTIFDDSFSFPAPITKVAEECKTCPFLPDCTPFRKVACPVKNVMCREMKARQEKRLLEGLLHGAETRDEDERRNDC